jgi:hypothetical protein
VSNSAKVLKKNQSSKNVDTLLAWHFRFNLKVTIIALMAISCENNPKFEIIQRI